MARGCRTMWTAVLLGLVLLQGLSSAHGQGSVRLCVVGVQEFQQCEKLVAVIGAMAGQPSWSCLQENDRAGCILAVGNSQADTLVAEPQDIVHAYMQFGMRAVLSEIDGSGNLAADVAVVDKKLCERKPDLSLADLAGLKACFTGYGDGAGWNIPLGVLVDKGILAPVNHDLAIANDIESAEAFFSKTCAPGPADGERICTGCSGDCSDSADPYSGQKGALQCLSDGAGDVAFLRSDMLPVSSGSQDRNVRPLSDFRFLCPGGGCQTLDQPIGSCFLAQFPAPALLTRRFYDASGIQGTLASALADPGFQVLFLKGANPSGLIFSAALSGFKNVTATQLDYVGASALRAYEAFDNIDAAPLQASVQTVGGTENGNGVLEPPPAVLKWCTTSDAEQAVCASMAVILQANVNPAYTWGCVQMPSVSDCLPAIQNGTADFVTLDGGDVLLGSAYYDLKAFLYEVYAQDPLSKTGSDVINAVAVVKKDLCDANPLLGFPDLQGRTSCHPYYRQDAGWVAPIGFLLDSGFLPTINTDFHKNNDLESVQTFFTRVCAPGDEEGSRACSACAGNCSTNDPYAGYAGALNCLMNGGGDVAFVEMSAVTNYAKGGPLAHKWANTTVDGLRLLCPDVGCVEVGKMTTDCVLATVPPRAVVTRVKMAIGVPGQLLLNATKDKAFQALFFSGTNTGDAVFRADTRGLSAVTTSTPDFLGASTLESYSALFELDAAPLATNIIRWCAPDRAQFEKCLLMLPALRTQEASLNWQCILRNSTQACIDTVTAGDAEVTMLDGNHMFEEVGSGRMVPTVSESYNSLHSLMYKAVAVVHKSFCAGNPTLADLKGKNSCHGSALSAYGWTVPVGDMLRSGVMHPVNGDPQLPNDIESVEHFFGRSCAPGETDSESICSACSGNCGLHTDPYFGSVGAFRCLLEGAGDVAFVRHTTPGEYALGGLSAQPWSILPASDFKLLCPTGGCADIGQEATCSFADVPGATILARPDVSQNALALLKDALVQLGTGENPHFRYLFEQRKNPGSLIFDFNLHALNEINVSAADFLASTRLQFDSFGTLKDVRLQQGVPSKRRHRGLGAGAIVGIVFGVLAGVAIIVGASFFAWKRKFLEKNSTRRYDRTEGKLKLTAL